MDFKIDTNPLTKTIYEVFQPIAGGIVAHADVRVSFAAGCAFFDAGGPDLDYPGKMFELVGRSNGAKAMAYVNARGTGETRSQELVTNGDFSSAVGWSHDPRVTIFIGKLSFTGMPWMIPDALLPVSRSDNPVADGALIESVFTIDRISAGNVASTVKTQCGPFHAAAGTYTDNLVVPPGSIPGFNGTRGLDAEESSNADIDNFSQKQILTPSPTGVTLVSTPAAVGIVQSWTSIATDLNYNDPEGFLYTIYERSYVETLEPNMIVISRQDVVVDVAQMTWGKVENIMNNIYLSLIVRRGSFFQNTALGSRLHLLQRAKNTPKTAALAEEYCKEALQWLIDTDRAIKIDVASERDRKEDLHRLKLRIEVTQADGRQVSFDTFVEVV